jgi:hypothetical protein
MSLGNPAEHVDPDGMHAVLCAWLETIGYKYQARYGGGRA